MILFPRFWFPRNTDGSAAGKELWCGRCVSCLSLVRYCLRPVSCLAKVVRNRGAYSEGPKVTVALSCDAIEFVANRKQYVSRLRAVGMGESFWPSAVGSHVSFHSCLFVFRYRDLMLLARKVGEYQSALREREAFYSR